MNCEPTLEERAKRMKTRYYSLQIDRQKLTEILERIEQELRELRADAVAQNIDLYD